jgi:hypothetical protein
VKRRARKRSRLPRHRTVKRFSLKSSQSIGKARTIAEFHRVGKRRRESESQCRRKRRCDMKDSWRFDSWQQCSG